MPGLTDQPGFDQAKWDALRPRLRASLAAVAAQYPALTQAQRYSETPLTELFMGIYTPESVAADELCDQVISQYCCGQASEGELKAAWTVYLQAYQIIWHEGLPINHLDIDTRTPARSVWPEFRK